MSQEALSFGQEPLVISSVKEGVTLKQWALEDTGVIFDLMQKNADFLEETGFDYFVNKFKTIADLEKEIIDSPKISFGIWEQGKLSGAIEMYLDDEKPDAYITYWIDQGSGGKNLATKATKTLAEYCFNDMGLRRLEAATNFINIASARSLQKAGFRLYGESSISWMFKLENPNIKWQKDRPVVKVIEQISDPKEPKFSEVRLQLSGMNTPAIDYGSTTLFTVEKGDVAFAVHDAQGNPSSLQHLKPKEGIMVPKGHRYQHIGWAVLRAVSSPAFDASKVEYL